MAEPTHRTVETNGIRMHVVEHGDGPAVVLCHGFPELWYSWRFQISALAEAGYRVIAPDLRGCGDTDAPAAVEAYTQLHLVGDLVGLLNALDVSFAAVVGHDWGAPVAWNAALLRPDRFPAVAGLSVPYLQRGPVSPLVALESMVGDGFLYVRYFQEPGVAEAELNPDPSRLFVRLLAASDPDLGGAAETRIHRSRTATTFMETLPDVDDLPAWITPADIDVYADAYRRTGFRGGLNWYRNIERSWELMAPYAGAPIAVPALFVIGDRDGMWGAVGPAIDDLPRTVPGVRMVRLDDCGHWAPQERPELVNAELLAFLDTVPEMRR